MSSPRETATERMHRVLAELLWIAERDGPTLAEAAARFGVSEKVLQADLELATMVGADSDDFLEMPVEMYLEGDRVFVHLHAFERPLRLRPEEAFGLIASGSALRAGGDADGPLARAVGKLAALMDIDVDERIEVDLGLGDNRVVQALQAGIENSRAVEIDHIGSGSGARRKRVVEPWSLFRENGSWYLLGLCREADDERTFRLDGIVSAEMLDHAVVRPSQPPAASALKPTSDSPRLVLDLRPEGRWVIEAYPTETVEVGPGDTTRATLAVVSTDWAERLLLRLGPDATVHSADPPLGPGDPTPAMARKVLARYGSPDLQG